jgi:glutamate synthase (NADPH/NADH) large chain/glutamate synthase (ferredoxin)
VNIHYLVQRRRAADQDGPGRQARRGRPAARPQGRRLHRPIRFTTPGVGLISPPPHHDIYSIEDLKQLIYDLRCANPGARVSVKLVAEVGVGTVAAGVAKANADHVLISGHDGGTGASPQSSIQSAGVPWEIGLAETQQTLVLNDLRSRIWVQCDGQMKTGRDVVVAALLGADEVGFSTAPLIAMGCIMMRVCHLNTCPVGIATQDPALRERFEGTPEHVVNYLFFVAEEAREIMAGSACALRRADRPRRSARGRRRDRRTGRRAGRPHARAVDARRARGHAAAPRAPAGLAAPGRAGLEADRGGQGRDRPPRPVTGEFASATSTARSAACSRSWITQVHGAEGLPPETIRFTLRGSAGQSFGAWLAPGVELTLIGDANDYTGKGLSGGVRRRPAAGRRDVQGRGERDRRQHRALRGDRGRAFFRGLAGERFAVRNSARWRVVEGVGDHGCEYMTGGRIVVLGRPGATSRPA